MADALLETLTGETVIHANPLATVTRNCLLIRDESRKTQVVIGIQNIRALRKVDTTHVGLLAIAGGLFTIAAAAQASHTGSEASAGIALLGIIFVLAYFSSRQAAILCLVADGSIETRRGTFQQATAILRAVKRMRDQDRP
jgi:hypothetical protein